MYRYFIFALTKFWDSVTITALSLITLGALSTCGLSHCLLTVFSIRVNYLLYKASYCRDVDRLTITTCCPLTSMSGRVIVHRSLLSHPGSDNCFTEIYVNYHDLWGIYIRNTQMVFIVQRQFRKGSFRVYTMFYCIFG